MSWLIRRSLRGRRGQVAALAITMAFSAMLVAMLGLLTETGVSGQVSTGEYAAAPVLIGAHQARPVPDDVDLPVPGRALMPAAVVDEVAEALPDARVVADRIVPAVLVAGQDDPIPVEVHPWSATELGGRSLASGRAPEAGTEIVLSGGVDGPTRPDLGDIVALGFGDEPEPATVVGILAVDDSGTDVADVYLSDDHHRLRGKPEQRVAVVGVWPRAGDDTAVLRGIAERNGGRLWPAGDRGEIEVVRQGPAKGALVSAAAAFGALAIIVSAFTLVVLTSLQIRERSRELAMLRVIGATPRQVKRLLRGEIRGVAVAAAAAGALAGPLLGAQLVGVLRFWEVIPRSLEPVYGPWPSVAAFAVAIVSAEIAVLLSLGRAVRGSPLTGLDGADERKSGCARALAGWAGVTLGLIMASAPAYVSGEAAVGLPALAGLVIAISIGPLSPLIVRLMAWTQQRRAARSAPRYLAIASLSARSARVGGALTPIVLGVSLSCTQLFSGTTLSAIAVDEFEAGHRADLLVTAASTGVADGVAEDLAATAGVASVQPIVTTSVLIRGRQHDANWQSIPALAVGGDQLEQYADLQPVGSRTVSPAHGGVALSAQLAAALGIEAGEDLEIVLPDGQPIKRHVTDVYLRGLGFGDAVLPIDDVQPATATGNATALAVTVADGAALP